MLKKLIGTILVVLVVFAGLFAYVVLKPPAAASAPLTALPITTQATNTSVSTSTSPASTTSSQNSSSGQTIYQIVPADSQVSFTIDEVLNGSPNMVVGTTDQVAGQISLNLHDPAAAQVGPIQVDARTLVTDNNFRNRALKNEILDTNNYEYITFVPKTLSGLPSQVSLGQSYTFTMTGDLTIKDVTKSVTFQVTVTPVDATRLKGAATTTVKYSDFGLFIPQVPSVASVSDSVILDITFVATHS